MGRWLLYGLCAPWDAVLVLFALLVRGLLGHAWQAERGVIWVEFRPAGLATRVWRYSITLGHVVLMQPEQPEQVRDHELVHVRQYEAAVCSLWLVLLAWYVGAQWLPGPLPWVVPLLLGPWWGYFGGSLAAALRGTRPYLDNPFERHARAEVDNSIPLD